MQPQHYYYTAKFVFFVLAIVAELLATFNLPSRINLVALGLALWFIGCLIQ